MVLSKTVTFLTLVVLMVALRASVHAQSTDVVVVANGDRITGDVRRLERGQLAFRTASAGPGHQRFAGTISIVWMEVVSLTSTKNLDITLASGERVTGSISSPSLGRLVVQTASGPTRPIEIKELVWITPIEAGFRGRTTGSIDFGLNFTNAEEARTYTLNADALHRSRAHAYETQVLVHSWLSARDDAERLTRNDVAVDVRRRLPQRWFALAKFEVQQDEPLALDVRLLAGGGVGRTLLESNRTRLLVQGGLDYDTERYDSIGSVDHSAEVFAGVDWDWFATGADTDAAVVATTFISLARQRARLEVDGTVRRDGFWDLYWALTVSESFDSDPPGNRPRSDLGVSFTLGWTF